MEHSTHTLTNPGKIPAKAEEKASLSPEKVRLWNATQAIILTGAREHNLKNVSLHLPKGKLIIFTGPSGSGKSSLAFDTLYAEGQRRYVESLSAYARQFLELMAKPDVDSIEGLSPAISIEQKTIANNPRSTVGTVTEVYDYLRLLFARVGVAHSPTTGLPIQAQTRSEMINRLLTLPSGTRFHLMAPLARNEKGEFRKEFADLKKRGFQRVHIDGEIFDLEDVPLLDRKKRHTVYVVVDRLVAQEKQEMDSDLLDRWHASVETALSIGGGTIFIECLANNPQDIPSSFVLSSHFSCPVSGFSLEEIEPRLFSFNNPSGACPQCGGIGLEEWHYLYEDQRYQKEEEKEEILRHASACSACQGFRLKPEALCVKIAGLHIGEVTHMDLQELSDWLDKMDRDVSPQKKPIAERILKEIKSRISFLLEVGLSYLTLSRRSGTLSGGESQRIRLASQVGSGLTGVLYVLDEPSIGLHQRDNTRLLKTLEKLRDLGNTVVVVEHDEEAMRTADYIVDFGPGAGKFGGTICAQGPLQDILASNSLTADYLSGRKTVQGPAQRRPERGENLTVVGAYANNLKNITVRFPLGQFIAVTGVSGSGKSSLIMDTLRQGLNQHTLDGSPVQVECQEIQGLEFIDKLVSIDQSPIGRTPRSNPATYTGLFTPIREWFSFLPEAKARGYGPGRFSFNVKGGRCEACQGDGVLTIHMHFLPDMHVPCEACKGKRYSMETLAIRHKGKSIADILAMSIEEAKDFFQDIPSIFHRLKVLSSVGLGYVQVGQSAPTLSGGEAQRVKLAKELCKKPTGKTVYILDEPTTGLHFQDVQFLLDVLHRLVDQGNTVIVIEHNLEVVKTADWVIDIGPEGGRGGGEVVAEGTPQQIVQIQKSITGRYLAPLLPPALA